MPDTQFKHETKGHANTLASSVTKSHFDPPDEMLLAFRPCESSRYRHFTRGEHTFQNAHVRIVVADGTRSDLASIPWFLRWAFSPTGRHQRAAVFHDRLCVIARTWADRLFADSMFYSLCRLDGVGPAKAQILYIGVRLGAYQWCLCERAKQWRKWNP